MWMPPWIVILLFGMLVSFVLQSVIGPEVMGRRPPHATNRRWAPPAEDIDPVCGKLVETGAALSSVHDGHVYFYCSPECRHRFEAGPARYVRGTRNANHTMMEHGHDIRHA
jgi:YHS domain-containing protein